MQKTRNSNGQVCWRRNGVNKEGSYSFLNNSGGGIITFSLSTGSDFFSWTTDPRGAVIVSTKLILLTHDELTKVSKLIEVYAEMKNSFRFAAFTRECFTIQFSFSISSHSGIQRTAAFSYQINFSTMIPEWRSRSDKIFDFQAKNS